MANIGETVIVIENEEEGILETWGRLTEMCEAREEFKYRYLSKQKFPITYKGWVFRKAKHRVLQNSNKIS